MDFHSLVMQRLVRPVWKWLECFLYLYWSIFNRKWQPNDPHGFYGPVEQSIAFQFCFKSVQTFSYSGSKVMQCCNLKYINWKGEKATTSLGVWHSNFNMQTLFAWKWWLGSINKSLRGLCCRLLEFNFKRIYKINAICVLWSETTAWL